MENSIIHKHPETGMPCLIDQSTGEYLPIIVSVFTKKIKNGFHGGWLAMSQTALESVVTNRELKLNDYRVFVLLSSVIDYENLVVVSQTEMAETLGISKGTLGNSMKKLVDLGIVEKGPKWGRNVTYRFNPGIGWKGTAANHQKTLKADADEALKKAKMQAEEKERADVEEAEKVAKAEKLSKAKEAKKRRLKLVGQN